MIKKQLAVFLSVFITAVSFALPLTTQAQSTNEINNTRSKVQTLSVKRDKKVEVKLRDKTKYKGYITAVDADSFTVTDVKTSALQRISYTDVVDVKKASGGISTKSCIRDNKNSTNGVRSANNPLHEQKRQLVLHASMRTARIFFRRRWRRRVL